MTSPKIIAGNWKMNGTEAFLKECLSYWQSLDLVHNLVICPPFTLLTEACKNIHSSKVSLGAQDCHQKLNGAFTGNISANHIKETGCSHVIIGHSERRQYHGENNDLIKAKAEIAISSGLKPIICVGENLSEREQGIALKILQTQITACLPNSSRDFLVAYEPVWAIGTGKAASLKDIEEVHSFLRGLVGAGILLLYGGSVTAENCKEILSTNDVDGVLVGGASLKKEDFGRMLCNQ
ncbi:MAG: triose-phosphate isomerase [Alphaproteobacteria bacterium]|nr:triose-phosphate isomerase [Alphaproteobacteria bacterium]